MRRTTLLLIPAAFALLLCSLTSAIAQTHVYTPASSLPQPRGPKGEVKARTHLRLMIPSSGKMNFGSIAANPAELPPFPGYLYETPASLACVYHLVENVINGCNPNVTTANPTGGSRAIAVVDAYDDPTAASDLAEFNSQFGLPPTNFSVVYGGASEPPEDPTGGWEIEEALDVEWAHAMAPAAQIILVEAASNSFDDLFTAVQKAATLVAAAGGGEISMSFGAGEFSGETGYDSVFSQKGIVYFSSTGDSPGTSYPAVSPFVVAAGGTSNSRNLNTGKLIIESTWQDAGGGVSEFEARPSFQNGIKKIVGWGRGTPDISFDANPTSGVWVYDSNPAYGTGWFTVGGTSVSSPSLAGVINAAGKFHSSSQAELGVLYKDSESDFNDIAYGDCGVFVSDFAVPGYDLCTGQGTPKRYSGK